MKHAYDIAIVGSGFAGSLLAMIARRTGRSVVLIEKGKHPRFAIGESSTPLANLLLEELADRYDLPRLKPLSKWGTWQQAYPQMACGSKRGFSFYHHRAGAASPVRFGREDQLLVAASPYNEIADTHWYRAEFDHFFVREAANAGVDYFDEVSLRGMLEGADGVTVEGDRCGKRIQFHARFLVDATGPRGFVHRALGLPEILFRDFPETEALYSHFSGVAHFEAATTTLEVPPYPVDDAALHHVFEGGWVWVLRFNNGLTSAGVAATKAVADELALADGAAAWNRLLRRLPGVQDQFVRAEAVLPFTHARRLAYRTGRVAGPRWAMLPSTAAFVDPLLSTGFPLTLLGVQRLAEMIEQDWGTPQFGMRLEMYSAQTRKEALATAQLIGALYASMGNFRVFISLTLLYFAAASFAETARRLGKHHRASSFLLCDHPQFGPACAELCRRARVVEPGPESEELSADILSTIEPFNVAGLGEKCRRNWYPADADDLLRSAGKLGASYDEVARLLERCGFQLAV